MEKRKDFLPNFIQEFGPIHLKILYGEHAGSGCRTLEQLQKWFTKNEFRKLKSFGYNCVEMEVDRILAESENQLVFCRINPLRTDIKIRELYE